MIIQPKIRGFICVSAHPTGCRFNVAEQINYIKSKPKMNGALRVLVIGCSTGYGLASRIAATYGMNAKTLGVCFEKGPEADKPATAGWYNTAAFEEIASGDGFYAKTIVGDAFADTVKEQVFAAIAKDLGQVDLVIYSLASPRRNDPRSGSTYSSVLKPIGETFTGKSLDPLRGEIKTVTIPPATPEEIDSTVKVMGGEDWQWWIEGLLAKNLLAPQAKTVAYTYLGPQLTHAIYKKGTIGRAKDHLKETADYLQQRLAAIGGEAVVSVNKAVVTQSSAAIPVVPLYIAILFKLMKEQGTHEGCIEQLDRLYREHLYAANPRPRDAEGYIRIDDWEMEPALQAAVEAMWPEVTTENLTSKTDLAGYIHDFQRLFGFDIAQLNYALDVDPLVAIPSLSK